MTKEAFLRRLEKNLSGIPKEDIKRSLDYYSEMIDDRIEDGMTEEEAVYAVGEAEEAAKRIIYDIPLAKLVKNRVEPGRRMRAWEIVLLILGAPLWIALLATLVSAAVSLLAALYSIVISLYAVVLSLGVSGFGGILIAFLYLVKANSLGALFIFAVALVCVGLATLFFFASNIVTKWILLLTKKMLLGVKKLFISKEG